MSNVRPEILKGSLHLLNNQLFVVITVDQLNALLGLCNLESPKMEFYFNYLLLMISLAYAASSITISLCLE